MRRPFSMLSEPALVAPHSHETTPAASRAQTSFWKPPVVAALFILIAAVYIGTTAALPLVGRDEPRYVEVAKEMWQHGDWVTPRLGGFTWFEKPALLYWMIAASFSVFGVSEWAARLGPALCGVGTVALVYWMAGRVRRELGQWSAVALASSGGLLAFSHAATFDIVLTCAITLTVAAFFFAQLESKPGSVRCYLALFWLGVGLALLAKGLIGLVLPLGIAGVYALIRREKVRLGFWWGLPLAVVASAVWYGPVIAVNGWPFIQEFFVQHHFARYLSDKYKHHQPFWFYGPIFLLLALPWTPFLVGALVKYRLSWREDSDEARLRALGLAWMLVPIAFFSLSGSKLPSYVLPALPGAFLLIGGVLVSWTASRGRALTVWGLAGATLLGAAVLTTTGPGVNRAEEDSVRDLLITADSAGYSKLPIVQFNTMQRAAEFYGAGQVMYGKDEEPVELERLSQLKPLVTGQGMLLFLPPHRMEELNSIAGLQARVLDQNRKVALVLVRKR